MFCSSCGTSNDDAAKFCQKCGARLAAAAPERTPPPPPDDRMRGDTTTHVDKAPRFAVGRNPAVALILSLVIVGVGQFYNGDNKKGAIMLGGALVAGVLTAGLGWVAVAIWSAVDAYRVASGKAPLW
jgi:TM2 domain-containing membrane protein YozV